ncbi:hypothetical protein [Enterobacter pseudoroggenkampii]|uniref:hypothetical protein n=1 Tax=Enterobacter pseudoroggenkampii TaxID=2996112 RepID=UPI0022645C6F|nr:hypothetical protein [Enterobacter pseudoroggenkampii]MCX8289104.1 hypothetical protein [Enterobacter pseudoroggenkampii]
MFISLSIIILAFIVAYQTYWIHKIYKWGVDNDEYIKAFIEHYNKDVDSSNDDLMVINNRLITIETTLFSSIDKA